MDWIITAAQQDIHLLKASPNLNPQACVLSGVEENLRNPKESPSLTDPCLMNFLKSKMEPLAQVPL